MAYWVAFCSIPFFVTQFSNADTDPTWTLVRSVDMETLGVDALDVRDISLSPGADHLFVGSPGARVVILATSPEITVYSIFPLCTVPIYRGYPAFASRACWIDHQTAFALAACDRDCLIRIGIATGVEIVTGFTYLEPPVISPDRRQLAGTGCVSGDTHMLLLWNLEPYLELSRFPVSNLRSTDYIQFTHQGMLAVLSVDGALRIIDGVGQIVQRIELGAVNASNVIALSSGAALAVLHDDGTICVLQFPFVEVPSLLRPGERVVEMSGAARADALAVALESGEINIFDVGTERLEVVLCGNDAPVVAMDLSEDGEDLAVVRSDGTMEIWAHTVENKAGNGETSSAEPRP